MGSVKMSAQEYEDLKGFLLFFTTNIENVQATPMGNLLVDELSKMEKTAPGRAQTGLKMMVNDCLEMSGGWRPEKVMALDQALRSAGLVTLTELRHRYSRQYAKILQRGSIKNQEEYYLVKGVLDGLTSLLGEGEQATLMNIISVYEERAVASGKVQGQ